MTRTRAAAVRVDLRGLPGARLRAALAPWLMPQTLERVIDPILADLHTAWAAAADRPARARARARAALDLSRAAAWLAATAAVHALARELPRRLGFLLAGATVAAALFWLMQSLIAFDLAAVPAEAPFVDVDMWHDVPDTPVTPRPRLPEPPVTHEPPPIVEPSGPDVRGGATDIGTLGPVPIEPIAPSRRGLGALEGPPTPLYREEPLYPRAALQRRLEGWVLVELTIGVAGSVTGARVLDGSPAGVFDRAALRAVRRWRYRPMHVDGRPVEHGGLQVVLEFRLDD